MIIEITCLLLLERTAILLILPIATVTPIYTMTLTAPILIALKRATVTLTLIHPKNTMMLTALILVVLIRAIVTLTNMD